MKIIAMIPVRLGSKRIPKKNLRYMHNKPLLQYPIDLAKSVGFDSIWVNTESLQLKPFVESMGVNFHKRPDELANDNATNREFVYEFMKKHECDYVVMLNTTSPLIRKKTLENFLELLNKNKYDTIISVLEEKAECFFQDKPLNFSLKEKVNSQLLEPVEKIVWSITAWRCSTFVELQEKGLNPVYGGSIGRFHIPKDEASDLDTQEDWNIAEGILYKRDEIENVRYLEI